MIYPLIQEASEKTIDAIIDEALSPVVDVITSFVFYAFNFNDTEVPFVLIWLLSGAIFFTFFLKFINIRGFKHALDVVKGKYDNPNDPGEVSHFQALTTALSGTVGVGNIAGVAIAISLGGPGATFWMILAGIFGMSAKFAECTLGLKYRKKNEDGSVSGGPMYFLSEGLKKRGMKNFGKILAVLFAITCIGGSLGGGNIVQVNQATSQLIEVTGGENSFLYGNGWIFGIFMAFVVALIIIGGIKSIARVTDKIVPFMVGVYLLGVLVVLGYHFTDIPSAFGSIVEGAFTKNAAFGGFIGVLILGFRRAAFSNEAGIGSASIAHSTAQTKEPVSEGVVSLLEPFIDTVVVCTMTALVIIITGNSPESTSSITAGGAISLTSRSFESVIRWFPIVLSISVIFFALSTMISWSYYGLKAWTYLFGENKRVTVTFRFLYCFFVIIGSAVSAKSVFDFGDAMIFSMAFPNVIGLIILAPEVRKDMNEYFSKVKSGIIKKHK